jgi:hypothetical protein
MEKNKNRIISTYLAIIILVLGYASCSPFELPTNPGAVLFQDDFSSPQSGWDQYHNDIYVSDYLAGTYRITIFKADREVWAVPELEFTDIDIQVNAKKLQGPDDNVYGLICRYLNPDNFVFFTISSDGYYGIGLYTEGTRKLLTGESMLLSEAIRRGDAINNLRAVCNKERLTFYVNGQQVTEIEANVPSHGDVGLLAGTYERGGIIIEFDEFLVKNP